MKTISFLALGLTTLVHASNTNLIDVATKMLPSTKIEKVIPTEIENFYAVSLENGNIIYINPAKDLIFFGEIYTRSGQSLTEKHIAKLGAKIGNETLDISPLFKVSTRMNDATSKYGFIVFTDPDCPFCQQLEALLIKENVTIDYIYTPIDKLHPNAREKSIKSVMQKRGLSRESAITLIQEIGRAHV